MKKLPESVPQLKPMKAPAKLVLAPAKPMDACMGHELKDAPKPEMKK
jgi:hypothetical protein